MTYTEEMTTSEILLRLASMRNELLQAVNDIEKISKNICYKAEQTENSSEKPNNSKVSEKPTGCNANQRIQDVESVEPMQTERSE